jgi:hypothetical protein
MRKDLPTLFLCAFVCLGSEALAQTQPSSKAIDVATPSSAPSPGGRLKRRSAVSGDAANSSGRDLSDSNGPSASAGSARPTRGSPSGTARTGTEASSSRSIRARDSTSRDLSDSSGPSSSLPKADSQATGAKRAKRHGSSQPGDANASGRDLSDGTVPASASPAPRK